MNPAGSRAERPILFSAPMINALLRGAKTQTRRVVRRREDRDFGCELAPHELAGEANGGDFRNAYCEPGTRLWVRETWADIALPGYPPTYFYRADDVHAHLEGWATPPGLKWRPSIHMPRAACRITLEVTGVRAERLQEISEADAIAEGIELVPVSETESRWRHYLRRLEEGKAYATCGDPRESFCTLWNSINGPGSWDKNPWVWVVEFRKTPNAS